MPCPTTPPRRRRRFCIRVAGGFLAGSSPIAPVPSPEDAVHFVDIHSARTRALLLHELGWRDLRVVEVLV